MSTHEPLRQEEDRINTPFIVSVGVISLALFAIGIFWTAKMQKSENGTLVNGTAPRPSEVGKLEVGIVFQPLFDSMDIANREKVPVREWLDSYGWADQTKQVAHIPVDRAMQMVVEKGKL
jgi:hypothetical protein